MLPGKKGSEAKNPGNRVSPPPPAPPPPKISKKQISEVRKRYGLSEEEAYEAFFNEGFSAGLEAKEKEIADLKERMVFMKCEIREHEIENLRLKQDKTDMQRWLNEQRSDLTEIQEKLTEASFNLKVWKARSKEFEEGYYEKSNALADTKGQLAEEKKKTTKIEFCSNKDKLLHDVMLELEAERKKSDEVADELDKRFVAYDLAKKLRSRKRGSEECLNCKEGSKGGRRITSIIMDECANLQPHQIEQMKKLSLGVDMAQGKDKTISPTLLERIEKQRNEILNKKGPDADLRLWMNAKTFCFLEKEDIVAHSIETGKLESLFGMPIVIDAAISDMGFMVIHWQPDEGK